MTEDIFKTFFSKHATAKNMLIMSRVSVLVVAIIAFILAMNPQDSILALVGNAWAGFGAAFGPLIILSLLWKRITAAGGLSGMLVGAITVLLWVYLPHDYKNVYEMIPAFTLSFLTTVVVSLFTKPVSKEVEQEFDKMRRITANRGEDT